MGRRRSVGGGAASRPLWLVLILGGLSTLLLLLAFSTSSATSRGRRFAILPPSYYRPSSPPPAFLVAPSAHVPAEHAFLPLMPPHLLRVDRRLAHLERLEALDAALGGFESVGFLGSENARQIERLRTCLEQGRWGGRCSPEGDGAKVVLVGCVRLTPRSLHSSR